MLFELLGLRAAATAACSACLEMWAGARFGFLLGLFGLRAEATASNKELRPPTGVPQPLNIQARHGHSCFGMYTHLQVVLGIDHSLFEAEINAVKVRCVLCCCGAS